MRLLKLITLGVGISLLSGCAVMDSDFDCNAKDGKGMGCASMSKVYQAINSGQVSPNMPDVDKASYTKPITVATGEASTAYQPQTPSSGQPIRYSESVQRIWIAPFQDKKGNYHDAHYIYTVVAPAHWIDRPQSAIKKSSFRL